MYKTPKSDINKFAKKKQILRDLEESIKWIKLYQEGKVKAKPIQQFLNELSQNRKTSISYSRKK